MKALTWSRPPAGHAAIPGGIILPAEPLQDAGMAGHRPIPRNTTPTKSVFRTDHMAAPPVPTPVFAVEQTGKLLGELNSQIKRTLRDPDPDAVHDVRVDIRKLSQAMQVFKPWFPAGERNKLRPKLKRIMDLTSDVRNCDVALTLLKKSKAKAAAPLQSTFKRRRKAAERTLAKALRRWVDRASSSKWRANLLAPPKNNREAQAAEPITNTAERVVSSMTRDFFVQGREAAKVSTPKKLHKFRITCKKFRYTLQLMEPVLGSSVKERLEQTENIQKVLGRVNDYATTRRMLAKEHAPKKLDANLKKKQREKIAEFRRYWATEVAKPEPVHARIVKRPAPTAA